MYNYILAIFSTSVKALVLFFPRESLTMNFNLFFFLLSYFFIFWKFHHNTQ
jgi:hypothetical protein